MYHYLRCNTIVLEYRGYGNSQGSPSEHGLRLDALAALSFAERLARAGRINPDRLFVFGRSLGGAVATWLAAQRPDALAGLVVENTFTSIEDMAVELAGRFVGLGALERPLRAFLHVFMTSHWRSIDLAPSLAVPALFICGLADELVPPSQMQALHAAAQQGSTPLAHSSQNNQNSAGAPAAAAAGSSIVTVGGGRGDKVFFGVPGGEHNTTFFQGGQPYYAAYAKFIAQYSRKAGASGAPGPGLASE